MGEDFIERRHRQIRRCIDREFERFLKSPDLFSGVPPQLSSDVLGFLVPGQSVSPGQKLVHFPQGKDVESFVLSYGKSRVVELYDEAATNALQNGAVSAEVVTVFPEDGLVALKFHARYEKH
jgi:hypothetical protein